MMSPGQPLVRDCFSWLRRFASRVFGVLTGLAVLQSSTTSAQELTTPASDQQHVILVIGAPGTDEYRIMFAGWAARWEEATLKAGIESTVIGRTVSTDPVETLELPLPASAAGRSTQKGSKNQVSSSQQLEAALVEFGSVSSTEPLWIVFIGHGTFDGRTASLNLQGPDVSAERLAELFKSVNRPIAFVGAASCTAPFINTLSSPGRVVISATKDGNQIQFCRFGDAISLAINGLEGDINRDGQTSLLEAWLFAARRTANFYETEGRLATEHSLLDDNGDSKGTRAEVFERDRPKSNIDNPELLDGKLAARWHLVRSAEERRLSSEQRQTRDALEAQVELLRRRKQTLEESDFLQQLEELMLPLARLYESAE